MAVWNKPISSAVWLFPLYGGRKDKWNMAGVLKFWDIIESFFRRVVFDSFHFILYK